MPFCRCSEPGNWTVLKRGNPLGAQRLAGRVCWLRLDRHKTSVLDNRLAAAPRGAERAKRRNAATGALGHWYLNPVGKTRLAAETLPDSICPSGRLGQVQIGSNGSILIGGGSFGGRRPQSRQTCIAFSDQMSVNLLLSSPTPSRGLHRRTRQRCSARRCCLSIRNWKCVSSVMPRSSSRTAAAFLVRYGDTRMTDFPSQSAPQIHHCQGDDTVVGLGEKECPPALQRPVDSSWPPEPLSRPAVDSSESGKIEQDWHSRHTAGLPPIAEMSERRLAQPLSAKMRPRITCDGRADGGSPCVGSRSRRPFYAAVVRCRE